MAVMTKEIAKELIPNGYEIDIDGKEYWISDSDQYSTNGKYSYFCALELGKEYEDDEDPYYEDFIYIAFPLIDEDDDRYNPESEEWDGIYDLHNPEVLETPPDDGVYIY